VSRSHRPACAGLCPSIALEVLLIALFSAISLSAGERPAAAAAPQVLDPGGLAVCTATGDQLSPRAVPAANGAAIVVWQDRRRGTSLNDLYAQSVAANGTVTPGWPADGVPLCATGTADPPFPVPDGAGGALVFWRDSRGSGTIFAQRVTADGTLAPGWPADGLQLTTNSPTGSSGGILDAIPDESGGAYVAWKNRPFSTFIMGRVSRVTASGTFAPGWSSSGIDFGTAGFQDAVVAGQLSPDPGYGVLFGLLRTTDPPIDFTSYGQLAKISSGGSTAWSLTLPTHISRYWDGTKSVSVTTDGAGGCLASWLDYSYPMYEEYMQHYAANASAQWPADMLAPAYQQIESDRAGGAYLIGSSYGQIRLDVHRRNATGAMPAGWTPAGITVTQPVGLGAIARTWFQGALLLCWSENKTGSGFDIRTVGVDAGGVLVGADPGGTLVSGASGDQILPTLSDMSPGRLLACWQDQNSGNWDIRASRIDALTVGVEPTPAAGRALVLGDAWPNPARESTRFTLSLPGTGEARCAVLDLSGRAVGDAAPARFGTSLELDVRGLANGVYWLRMEQGGASVARRFAVLH